MTRLKLLVLDFQFSHFLHRQTSQPPPPSTPITLPALINLRFQGWCEYLEEIIARIDTPQLDTMSISFFERDSYHTPQLFKFISCTNQLRSPRRVDAVLYDDTIKVKLYLKMDPLSDEILKLETLRWDSDWPLSSLARPPSPLWNASTSAGDDMIH